jgi:hypothetical protein
MPHKSKKIVKAISCVGCSLLKDEDFSCSLDVLFVGIGISKLQFLIKKIYYFFTCKFFPNFWSSKPWTWIRIRIETNADPKH